MKRLAGIFLIFFTPCVYGIELQSCGKVYKVSESETVYGCETCIETDSAACVYMQATCYKVTLVEGISSQKETECAPYTCGDVPSTCSILYSGIEELQSFEGQIVNCSNNTKQICRNRLWVPIN